MPKKSEYRNRHFILLSIEKRVQSKNFASGKFSDSSPITKLANKSQHKGTDSQLLTSRPGFLLSNKNITLFGQILGYFEEKPGQEKLLLSNINELRLRLPELQVEDLLA